MLAPAHTASYTNPPPLYATQHPQPLLDQIYEMYGVKENPKFNWTGIDMRQVHELTLQQVVGQRVLTQEAQIIRRQLNTQLLGLRVLAPIRVVNALKVRFPYMEWNPALIDKVPERGRVRGTSYTTRVVEKELERYAGGDHFGLEMLTTEIGPTVLAESRNTNVDAVMATLELTVWVEARRAYDVAWEMEKQFAEQNITPHSMGVMESRAKLHWALFQLNPRALYHLNTKTAEYQAKYGGYGNAWFIHMKSERYLAQVPDERIKYYEAGQGGPSLLESLPGEGVRVIGDKPVFVMQNMDVFGMGAMEVLENVAEYVEYYNMVDPFVDSPDYEGYTSESRSIHLVDCDRATWQRFTLMQALDASGRYGPDGEPIDVINTVAASVQTRDAFASPLDRLDSGYYIASPDGKQRLVRFMGQIEQRAFSAQHVLLLAQSVVRKLTGLSVTPQQATVYMNVLAKAVRDCNSYDPRADNVQAYISDMIEAVARLPNQTARGKDGLVEWARNGAYGSLLLPRSDSALNQAWQSGFDVVPFGGNYAMLQAVVTALREKRDQKEFVETYRLNYSRAVEIQKALDVFDEVSRSLERLLPGSVLNQAEYASPWFHGATARHTLFEGTLGQNRLPLFVRNGAGAASQARTQATTAVTQAQAAVTRAEQDLLAAQGQADADAIRDATAALQQAQQALAAARAGQSGLGIPTDEMRSQAMGLSTTYADDTMARLTGRLATRGAVMGRSTFIQANIGAANDAADGVVFDPRPAAGAKQYANASGTYAALPAFAKTVFAEFPATTGAPAIATSPVVTLTDRAPGLAAGASEADREQYLNVVKLLFNYRAAPSVTDTAKILMAERNRAIALLIASSVNTAPSGKDAAGSPAHLKTLTARLRAVFSRLLTPANNVVLKEDSALTDGEINPIFGASSSDGQQNVGIVRRAIGAFVRDNAEPINATVFDAEGVNHIVTHLPNIFKMASELASHIDQLRAAAMAAERSAATVDRVFSRAAGADGHDAGEYLRTPLTVGDEQFKQLYELSAAGTGRTLFALPADPLRPSQPVPPVLFGRYVDQMKARDVSTPPALYDEETVRSAAAALRMYNHMSQLVANARSHETYQEHRRATTINISQLQLDAYGNVLNWSSLTPAKEARAMASAEQRDPYTGRTYAQLAAEDDERAMAVDYSSVGLFQHMGKGADADADAVAAVAQDIVEMVSASFATNWALVSANAPDALTEIVAKVYLCQRHHRRVFEAAYRHNTLFPKRFLLFRRARFATLSALFAQAGGEAMETFVSFPRFYYGSDVRSE